MPCLVTRVHPIDQRVAAVLGSTHTATGRADVQGYRRTAEALFVALTRVGLADWVDTYREDDPPTPWRRIVEELRAVTHGGVDVSPQTLINWYGEWARERAA